MSRELFNQTAKSSRASSLLRGLCRAEMRETRQIAAFSAQAVRHPMHEAAIAPVGASLSHELFNHRKELASKLAPTGFVPCRNARDKADRSFLRLGRQAPHAGGCNCTCRSELARELFNQTAKSSRDKLAPTGFVPCRNAGDKADRSFLRPGRQAPHAGGCNCICRSELARELFNHRKELAPTRDLPRGVRPFQMPGPVP